MPTISWQWPDYWDYFNQIEEDKRKTEALKELNGNGWLARLSADQQAHIFMCAPENVLMGLKHFPTVIKRDAILILEHERQKKRKRMKR